MDTNTPPDSDNDENKGELPESAPIPSTPAAPEPSPETVPVGFEFTGSAGEYFKIWIVNLLLTVLTLGFYWPWAAVRSRRYMHANTKLDGHAFDYLAKPKNLLIGYLVILVFFGLYLAAAEGAINPNFIFPIFLVYGIAAPWMVFKALRFRARNTAYRNVRFKFAGHLGDSYATYMGWAMLVPLTLGFIVPYWEMKKKEYFLDNLQFGKSYFSFKPEGGIYYKYYILFGLAGFGLYIAFMAVVVGLVAAFGAVSSVEDFGQGEAMFLLPMIAGYLLVIAVGVVFQQGLWMCIFNYNMSVWSMGKLQFESRMRFGPFVWMSITNLFASILTLGLMVPWAKTRITKYRLENMYVLAPAGNLGEHFEAEADDEGAIGEAATDFMDFEIGM